MPWPILPSRSPQPLQADIGAPKSACRPPANLPSTRIRARIIAPVTPLPPSPVLAPSIGGFGVRQRTWEGYRGSIERYIIPARGNIALDKLLARHIQEMEVSLLRNGGVKGRGLSPRTVLQVHRILFKALRNAVRLDTLQRNVAEAVEPPRITRYEPRVLGWNEVHNLLSQITDRLYHTLVLLAIQTGLRRSELLGLQWRDVGFDTGTLSVQRALIKLPSGEMVLTQPKTGRGRVVALPLESVLELRTHRERQQADAQESGKFIFCHSGGSPLHPDMVSKAFGKMAKRANLEGVRLHDLRHTHASLMLTQGIHLKVVSERLGHSSIGITGDLYSHVLPTVQEEAVERFGAAWRIRMAKWI